MNNERELIEKLAIEHASHTGFREGNLEQVTFTTKQLEAFAKALQSSEPVAIPDNDPTKRVTLEKTIHIIQTSPYKVCGYILNHGDDYCLSYKQAVRWTDIKELFNFMHEIAPASVPPVRSSEPVAISDEETLRISKSGYSVKVGWTDKRIVACAPNNQCTPQWLEDAQRLCDGWNNAHPPASVPLEKTITAIEQAVMHGWLNRQELRAKIRQAIAEAEGKEG